MTKVAIRFSDPDTWESNREKVDDIIEDATGDRNSVSTRSLPPIILTNLSQDAIDKLKALDGVNVQSREED